MQAGNYTAMPVWGLLEKAPGKRWAALAMAEKQCVLGVEGYLDYFLPVTTLVCCQSLEISLDF